MPSYSFSDTVVTGSTNNAAINGHYWYMPDVLPAQVGLIIDGVLYRYTTVKDPEADLLVTIQNEDADGEGYVYKHEDDWSGLPGNTKVGYDPFIGIPAERFGPGSITTQGDGSVEDVTVRYTYRYDICADPLADPGCPGFQEAFYQYLLDNNLLNSGPEVEDPYYDEWVQLQLNQETEVEDEEEIQEEEESEGEKSLEEQLDATATIEQLVNTGAEELYVQLSSTVAIDPYYGVSIPGGEYNDILTLEDTNIPDNGRALRSLASDRLHRTMVRSQYEKSINGEN